MPVSTAVRRFKRQAVWWLLLMLLIALAVWWGVRFWDTSHELYTDQAYVKADIVWLVAPIAGELIEFAVQEQQQVQQGEVVAVIKDTERVQRETQVQALTALKRSALEIHQQTELAQQRLIKDLQAELGLAQQALIRLNQTLQQQQVLWQAGLVSAHSVESLQIQVSASSAQIASLNARLLDAQQQQRSLQSRRMQLEQELQLTHQAAAELPNTTAQVLVDAPITGQVSSLSVQLYHRVAQGTRLMALTAPDSMYVEAWFDEPQVERMRLGQRVKIVLDAYPEPALQGYVTQLRPEHPLPPLQNSRVRRLPVRISLPEPIPSHALSAGLAASVWVDLRHERQD